MQIAKISIGSLFEDPEFPALIAEYERESAVEGLPAIQVKMENYRLLELTGQLHTFAALHGNTMVGFIIVAMPPQLHFSVPLAVTESFFVAEAHRKGGMGLRLLAAAEKQAEALGSPVLFVCAPLASRLCDILPRRGYRETNRVFVKRVGNVH